MQKIIIGGCPRSGTTIVQRYLSNRYNLYTLPETGFFARSRTGFRGRCASILRLYAATKNLPATTRINKFNYLLFSIVHYCRHYGLRKFAKCLFNTRAASQLFDAELTRQSIESKSEGWIEKTPSNALYFERIAYYIPEVKLILVVRKKKDVAASIRARSIKHAPELDHEYAVSDICNLMAPYIEVESNIVACPRIFVLNYEKFASGHLEHRMAMDNFIGISAHKRATNTSTATDKKWQPDVDSTVQYAASKWDAVFSSKEKRKIETFLENMNVSERCAEIPQSN